VVPYWQASGAQTRYFDRALHPRINQNGANGTSFGPTGRSYGAFHVLETGAIDWASCFARANAGELATSATPTNKGTAAFFIVHSFAQVFDTPRSLDMACSEIIIGWNCWNWRELLK
jgi:hypothetical protein